MARMSYTVLLTIEFLSYREDFLTAVEQVDWHVHVVRWTDCHSPLRQEDFRLEIELRHLQIFLPGIFLPFCVLRGQPLWYEPGCGDAANRTNASMSRHALACIAHKIVGRTEQTQ